MQESQGDTKIHNDCAGGDLYRLSPHEFFERMKDATAEEFVKKLTLYQARRSVAEADAAEGKTPLYWFVWLVSGHPYFAGRPVDDVWADLDGAVEQFLGIQGWQKLSGTHRDDAESEFYKVWGAIRFPPGSEPLELAFERALSIDVGPLQTAGRPGYYPRFVALAGCLQQITGGCNIYLPCERVGQSMGKSKMTISSYRRWALEDDYLRLARPHQFRSKGGSEATEFRFNVALFPLLGLRAEPGMAESFGELPKGVRPVLPRSGGEHRP